MKSSIKRLSMGMMAVVLAASIFAGCSGQKKPGTSDGATTETTQKETSIDISKKVDLKMYLVGDKPADGELVYAEMNKVLENDLNAKLDIEFLAWSDYKQKYPLILASGEVVDLIYASDWAGYSAEATKGAFAEVTDEILQKYMPETYATQEKISWEQAKVEGKIYFVPKNASSFNNENLVLIRGDLREKYGIPELKSVDDLEAYYTAVAQNEKGIFAYAGAQNNDYIRNLTFVQANNLLGYTGPISSYFYKYTDGKVTADQFKFTLDMPEYIAWAKRMKSWADKGFWSKNAISNKTQTKDAFVNGTSASMISNLGTLVTNMDKVNKEHPDWKAEIFDITPNNVKRLGKYTADGMAVAAATKNLERSFMVLDKLKNDRELNELWLYGLEGKHWVALGDNSWKQGPDYEKYMYNTNCQWGVVNDGFKRIKEGENPIVAKIEGLWMPKVANPVTEGFKYEDANVKNELAAAGAVRTKYQPLVDFGLMEDVDAIIAEYKANLEKAGVKKAEAEFYSQLEKFLATK